jgi:hypothetical protein
MSDQKQIATDGIPTIETLEELRGIDLFDEKFLGYKAIKDLDSGLFAGQTSYEKDGKVVRIRTAYCCKDAKGAVNCIELIHSQMIQAAAVDEDDLMMLRVVAQDNACVNKAGIISLVNPGELMSQEQTRALADLISSKS